uniref:DNA binding protein hu-like protein histon like protein n=1 Tax=Chroomonas placoidea TaxID=173977 RepID=A0A222AIB8_9CRYP|nr:DNA binding protein hu-like protein histon like protein [Chroomonas placoidea]ASO76107.1 DNA binding protein hu-like protein histon like protein [Chroomonas placoidea]
MNKGELINKIVEKTNVSKKEADLVLTTILETIVDTVSSGEKVTLVGFGSFEARERKGRRGRNPRTGETIAIPPSRLPAFSVGKFFKNRVNE